MLKGSFSIGNAPHKTTAAYEHKQRLLTNILY